MAGRGQLTDSAKAKMEAFLGRTANPDRIGGCNPYIHFVMMNEQRIDPKKINGEERQILFELRAAGHVEGGASGLAMTREFWDFLCDILFDTYVAHESING